MTASAVAAPAQPATPFKGLDPYEERDAAFFFGRNDEVEVVIANLEARRLTLLYGDSGVGKSSLLRAGVMHRLQEQVRKNMDEIGAPELVPVYFAAWRDNPLPALLEEIGRAVATVLGKPARKAPRRLDVALKRWSTQTDAHVLVVLDQFEEYLLYHPLEHGKGTLADELPLVLNSAGLRARFLIAIREDALAKLDRFKREIPALFGTYLRLKHLDRNSAEEAIRCPIDEYNKLAPTGEERVDIEQALVKAVLDQVTAGQVVLEQAAQGVARGGRVTAGEERIETPYLQLVMERLWEEEMRRGSRLLRLSTLHELGGAQTIVRTHLDEALRALPDRQQDLVADLFNHLVTPSGTKIAHTPSDLAEYTRHPLEEIEPALEALSGTQTRILRPVTAGDGPVRYEIFHDVLAAAVLDWRARHILERQRVAAEEHARKERRRLERERKAAEEQARTEQQRLEREREAAEAQARLERRRARMFRALAALATLLLVLVGVGAFLFVRWSDHQADLDKSREFAARASDLLDRHLDLALPKALEAWERGHTNEARSALLAARQRTAGLVQVTRPGRGRIWGAALDRSGRYLATAGDGGLRVWDRALGTVIPLVQGAVSSVAFSPGGDLLAGSTTEGTVVLKTPGFRRLDTLPSVGSGGVAIGAGGQWLAAAGYDGLELWRLKGRRSERVGARRRDVNKFAFSPRDPATLAVVAGNDSRLELWKLPSMRSTAPGGPTQITAIAFSPDGTLLALADAEQHIRFWSVADWRPVGESLAGNDGVIESLAFSADGRTLASGARDRSVILWDVSTPRSPQRISGPLIMQGAGITTVALAHDLLAVTSYDGAATFWGVNAFRRQRVARVPSQSIFSPDGRLIASFDQARTTIRNVEGSRRDVISSKGTVEPLVFDADSAKLLTYVTTGSGSSLLRLWDVRQRRYVDLPTAVPVTRTIALSPSGEFATATDSTVALWNRAGDRLASTSSKGYVTAIAVTFAKTLAWGDSDGRVAVWHSAEGAPKVADAHTSGITKLAFSPDGHVLAVASDDSTISLWDVKSARRLGTLVDHTQSVKALAFSRDGKTLASGAWDSTGGIRLWDVKTFRPLGAALSPPNLVSQLAFGPQGLVALTTDGMVLAWDKSFWTIDFKSLRQQLCGLLGGDGASRQQASGPEQSPPQPCGTRSARRTR
jgi:WD40 repeat protein